MTSTTPSISSSRATPTWINPKTCGEYLALTAADKKKVVQEANWRATLYTSEGVSEVDEYGLYEKQCPGKPSDTTLLSLRAEATSFVATCAEFTRLTDAARTQWRDHIVQIYRQGPTVAQLLQACKDSGSPSLADAAKAYVEDHPARGIIWTVETKLGYTSKMTMTVGEVMWGTGSPIHPNNTTLTAGSACSFDPTKDAAVPVTVTAMNTTKNADYAIAYSVALVTSYSSAPTVTPEIEAGFSDGNQCKGDSAGVEFQTPTKPGAMVGNWTFFVILHNYISPRYPSGATADLGVIALQGGAPFGSTDPIVKVSNAQKIWLNGTRAN